MAILTAQQQSLVDLSQQHMQAELDGDLETTMATMTDHPHLYIYWDQAGVLAQIGLLDPTGLPVNPASARTVLDPILLSG